MYAHMKLLMELRLYKLKPLYRLYLHMHYKDQFWKILCPRQRSYSILFALMSNVRVFITHQLQRLLLRILSLASRMLNYQMDLVICKTCQVLDH